MLVFFVVFDVLLSRGTDYFLPFLLCGIVPWLWFNRSVANAAVSISGAKHVVLNTKVPLALFPLETILHDAVKQILVLLLLMLFLWIYGYSPTIYWLFVPALFVFQLLIVIAVGVLFSTVEPFFPDVRYIIGTGLQLMMFGSGIFYPVSDVPSEYLAVFLANPMAALITSYRNVLLFEEGPILANLAIMSLVASVVLGLALLALRVNQQRYVMKLANGL